MFDVTRMYISVVVCTRLLNLCRTDYPDVFRHNIREVQSSWTLRIKWHFAAHDEKAILLVPYNLRRYRALFIPIGDVGLVIVHCENQM
jgi:hypothetical protein